jgi:hypothetical protein
MRFFEFKCQQCNDWLLISHLWARARWKELHMLLFVALMFLQGANMILVRLWIVEEELTILEFGTFDQGWTYDGTSSPTWTF